MSKRKKNDVRVPEFEEALRTLGKMTTERTVLRMTADSPKERARLKTLNAQMGYFAEGLLRQGSYDFLKLVAKLHSNFLERARAAQEKAEQKKERLQLGEVCDSRTKVPLPSHQD